MAWLQDILGKQAPGSTFDLFNNKVNPPTIQPQKSNPANDKIKGGWQGQTFQSLIDSNHDIVAGHSDSKHLSVDSKNKMLFIQPPGLDQTPENRVYFQSADGKSYDVSKPPNASKLIAIAPTQDILSKLNK
jgi:hypothetical protein